MINFIVAGAQRTGSSVFAESLGLNPLVCCGGESILKLPITIKIKAARNLLMGDFSYLTPIGRKIYDEKYSDQIKCLGFRWIFHASAKWIIHPRYSPKLWLDRFKKFLDWIENSPKIHIIHITRHDNIDWLKSVYIARKTSLYSKEKYPDGVKVRIPKWEAIKRIHKKNWIDSRLASLKKTNPYLNVRYENFNENQNQLTTYALKFLHIDPEMTNNKEPSLKKQSKGNASNYIINYKELVNFLSRKKMLTSQIY